MIEEWRDIPGWEGLYQASSLGNIRSLDRELPSGRWGHVRRRGGPMKPKMSNGYLAIGLRRDGERKWYGVHRLVCMAFHGLPVGDRIFAVHFPDPTPTNCRAGNVMWGTPKENSAHREIHGTDSAGEANASAILKLDQVLAIRRDYVRGRPCHPGNQRQLAAEHGISPAQVQAIANGKSWKRLGAADRRARYERAKRALG